MSFDRRGQLNRGLDLMTGSMWANQFNFDRIEQLHRRLYLLLGSVWADQLIIAINTLTTTSTSSYVDLLEQATATVLKTGNNDDLQSHTTQ